MGTGYTGIGQYFDWGTSTTLLYGLAVVGGEIGPGVSPVNHRQSIYGRDYMVGGLLDISGSVEFEPTATTDSTLMNYALRSSATAPSLTDLCFEGGHASEHGYKHTGCKIGRLQLAQSVEEALRCSVDWVGTDVAKTPSPAPKGAPAGAPCEWFQGAITLDTGTYDVQSITVSLENGLTPGTSLDTKSTNSKRNPEFIRIGSEAITCSLVLASPANNSTLFDLMADTLDTDIDVVWTATNGTVTFTITIGNLACSTNPMPFQSPDGEVVWNVELEGLRNDLTTLTIAV